MLRRFEHRWIGWGAVAMVLLVCSAACSRPKPLVLCHNANCVGPPDPSQDDTIERLRASLGLQWKGKPILDGVEIDLFWDGAQGRCLFAHDLNQPAPSLAMAAAEEIARYLARPGPISWNGDRFFVRMELKGFVGTSFYDKHSAEQARSHASCALDVFETISAASDANRRKIVVIFDSSAPDVLRTLTSSGRWPGRTRGEYQELRLSADFIDSTPSGFGMQRLAEYSKVDDVVFHAGWINDGHYQAFRSMDLQLTLWMFSATTEVFGAIERFSPDAVLTNEAELVRRWEEE